MTITAEQRAALHAAVDKWADDVVRGAPSPPQHSAPDPTIPHGLGKLTFMDTFGGLDWNKWDSIFNHSDPVNDNGCTLIGNGERQWYPNHRRLGSLAAPWSAGPDGLVIRATKLTPAERGFAGYNRPDLNTIGKPEYLSGLLSSHISFSQQYGYFEIECKMPAGRGLWPAFWMKAQSGAWPPEIDVFEMLGHEPTRLFTTTHYDPDNKITHIEAWADWTAWHTIGYLWTPDVCSLWVDGVEQDNKLVNHVHEPMHLLVNLAVGGSWPEQAGPVDESALPAELWVRRISAWELA